MMKLFGAFVDFVSSSSGTKDTDYDVVMTMSESESDFIERYAMYMDKPSHDEDNIVNIEEKFESLKCQCTNPQDTLEVLTAKRCLLMPFQQGSLSDGHFNTLIMNRWHDYLAQNYQNIANIHSHWNVNYIDDIAENGTMQSDRARLLRAEIIFWPICLGNHWYELIINQKDPFNIKISCLDGYNNFSQHPQIFILGQKLVAALHGQHRLTNTLLQNLIVPRQDNSYDCGTVACYSAHRICNELSPSWQAELCDYSKERLNIARAISSLPLNQFLNGIIPQGKRNNNAWSNPHLISRHSTEITNPKFIRVKA
ncbi:MAG: hypothetical protein JSS07_02860 [Proteobacteria bacterium]|nr:hypothetical protein [Pseudomonadota bacterium]